MRNLILSMIGLGLSLWTRTSGGGGGPSGDAFLLEDGSSYFLLEDGSSFLLME